MLQDDRYSRTQLTEFFKVCERFPDRLRRTTYPELPRLMWWDQKTRQWLFRTRNFNTIGRVVSIPPNAGETFYLRLLLYHVHCPSSWEALRTVNGVIYHTFQDACIAHGLLTDDHQLVQSLEDASTVSTPPQMRRLFVIILLECQPSDPKRLWEQTWQYLAEDCEYQLRTFHNVSRPTQEDLQTLALQHIEYILQERGRSLHDFNLPKPSITFNFDLQRNSLLRQELSYDVEQCTHIWQSNFRMLNEEQEYVVDNVVAAVDNKTGALFFLDGPGGCGKTFVENTIIAKFRSEGKIVLAIASSGIASLLLQGGRTSHSVMKIPIEITSTSTCAIPKQSQLAELLKRVDFIVWDEAPAQHRHCFEAVDRTLRDIRAEDKPFGGITVLFSGDFRQCLPVVNETSSSAIMNSCLTSSPLWRHIKPLKLTQNMRLQRPGMSEEQRAAVQDYSEWLLNVGNGSLASSDGDQGTITMPSQLLSASRSDMIDHVYPDLRHLPTHDEDVSIHR